MSHLDGPEFEGIFVGTGEHRPVMSKPHRMLPSAKLIHQVRVACDLDDATAERVADWAADWGERLGARTAKPVFDMDGYGPACSWCGVAWPLCGHQHLSEELGEADA
jgi:hypothetical protein